MRSFQCCIIILILFAGRLKADDLRFKEDALRRLVAAIPDILKTYDARTGHFGEGLWICRDQEAMYPLAVVYAQKIEGNRYCKDPALLKIIMDAGDALIADADDKGRSRAKTWRVSEKNLHWVSMLGGWPGAYLAQRRYRHKTAKVGFQFTFWATVVLHEYVAIDYILGWRLAHALLALIEK